MYKKNVLCTLVLKLLDSSLICSVNFILMCIHIVKLYLLLINMYDSVIINIFLIMYALVH